MRKTLISILLLELVLNMPGQPKGNMQAKGAARLQSAFRDCCIGDCRPLLQSVTITNHLSLFGHMNSLEFSLNTARGRTVDGELVTELLL
jgi:hypothetical protein